MNTGPDAGPAREPDTPSPFHEGEQRLQASTGVRDRMEAVGRTVIRGFMPDQHRDFFEMLPFIVAGGLDAQGQPWATLWAGPPGFMHSPDPTRLRIARPFMAPGDPLAAHWRDGAPIGLLGIQPHTRRRNRLNGTLRQRQADDWAVDVRQSFGNCPKYIRQRLVTWQGPSSPGPVDPSNGVAPASREMPAIESGEGVLSARARRLIGRADTFFLASSSPGAGQPGQSRGDGVDVSHRGGEPGFVHIEPAGGAGRDVLTVPDYVGNFMFNTLGNILLQPRVGLLFIDAEQGDLLWLAGRGSVDTDGPRIADFAGAQRLLRVRVDAWRLARRASPLRVDPAP